MRILIAGARGFVGSALARRLSAGHTVLALAHDELDVTDGKSIRRAVLERSPGLVINCAVLGVDACERDPARAWAVNAAGPENLARAAAESGAEFLHLSTNYVFDGRREDGASYTVADVPAPINVYGRTKLGGERAALAASARSYIVRTSWVFGPGKENFLSTAHRRLRAAETVRAITHARASATYLPDLVTRISEILTRRHYATYHVVNEGACSYYEFAVEAARLVGVGEEEAARLIEPVTEAETRRAAPRPPYTPLRCLVSEELGLAPLRNWREALADYVRVA